MHLFEKILSVCQEDIEFELRSANEIAWADFWLNPRRLRGSDFLMRWSQGVWAEKRVVEAMNKTGEFFAIPYGPSGTAPDNDVRAFELYFERLEAAGLGRIKRPDLLIFRESEKVWVEAFVKNMGGLEELPFCPESNLQELVLKYVIAVECENSLWVADKMPDFGKELKPQKRLAGKPGLSKTSVLPTIIIKEEDREPLKSWQMENKKPIHIWHVFYDRAYGMAFDEAERLVEQGYILPTEQIFQAPGGATTKKAIYKFYYHYAYPLGISTTQPKLIPDFIQDKNGHILPYVKFEGGSLQLDNQVIPLLKSIK